MIDFSAVYRNGLVVTCKTESDSESFWDDVCREFHGHSSWFVTGDKHGLHSTHRDKVAYYLKSEGTELQTEWCNEDWYRTHSPYSMCEFFEYGTSPNDFGEILLDNPVDLLSLICGEEAAT